MKIVFLGANNPETSRDIAAQQRADRDFEVLGFLDNAVEKIGTRFLGYPVLGEMSEPGRFVNLEESRFLNLITRDCVTRLETSRQISGAGGKFANVIHPDVILDDVHVGAGVYIQGNVTLQADTSVGNNSAINTGSIVSHESKLGNTVFMAPGGRIAGRVTVEDGVYIGIGAVIMPDLKIGRWSVIGAGSVVTKDVPEYSVVAGNPARILRTATREYDSGDILT